MEKVSLKAKLLGAPFFARQQGFDYSSSDFMPKLREILAYKYKSLL
jgi:hypothetical protein